MTALYAAQPPPPQASYPDPHAQPIGYTPPQMQQQPNPQFFQPPYVQAPPPHQPLDPYAPQPFYPQPHGPSLAPHGPFATGHGDLRRSSDFAASAFDHARRSSSTPRTRYSRHSVDLTPMDGESAGWEAGRRYSAESGRVDGGRYSQSSHHSRKSHHSGRREHGGKEYDDPADDSGTREKRPTLGDTMFAIWDKFKGR